MRVWKGLALGAALIGLASWPAVPAQAATTVTGRASTVLEWYDNAQGDTALPVYQYLQLNVRGLAPGYTFKGYGRLADDLNGEVDTAKSRLYYAYIENKNVLDGLDFRLGRQFIATTAGASLMDGLSLDYAFLDNYKLKFFGGGDVTYYQGYNVKDVVAGVELGGRFYDNLDVAASYLQKWDGGLLAQELAGFDVSFDLAGKLWLYSDSQWDILSERLSYELIGAKYRFDQPFTVRAEYLYSLPVFSSTSIYSVFAVEEYEELMAEATWMIQPGLQTFARVTHEIYDEYPDADVFEIGLEKLRTGSCSGYVTGILRKDSGGQDMKGFKAYGAYQFLPKLRAGAGASVDVFEREIEYFNTDSNADETTTQRFWADVLWNVTDKINLEGKVERVESDLWDYYNRGRIRLNILF